MTLLEAAKAAASWMRWWLDQEECECPMEGHFCGRPGRVQELEEIEKAIAREEGHA